MNNYRKDNSIYEEILEMEKLYSKTPMKYIKENLFQIRQKRRNLHIKHCKSINAKIGKFRLFENIFSEQAEHSYFNKSHPSNIPFMTLIKICNHLNICFEEIIKRPQERVSTRTSFAPVKWTDELIQEFISDYENTMSLEKMANKYNVSANTILRFYPKFKQGKDCNGKLRIQDN
ncbi:hypothetical protein FDB37_15855 [Clostridium botulinum]|nr:hypothetical protein [Clostridium botulinum]